MFKTAPFLVFVAACAANSQVSRDHCGSASGMMLAADTAVYDTTQVTKRPVILEGPELHYPDRARQEGIQGRVVLSIVVNADGRVQAGSVRVIESVHHLLDQEAISYAHSAVFQPACLDGRAVRTRVRLPIDFKVFR